MNSTQSFKILLRETSPTGIVELWTISLFVQIQFIERLRFNESFYVQLRRNVGTLMLEA